MKRFLPVLLSVAFLPTSAAGQDVNAMQMQARNMAGHEPQGDPVVTHDFAICVARKYGGAEILEMLPNTNDEIDFVWSRSRYGEVNCGPQNRRPLVGARFMRGGAAEYLLQRSRGEQDVFEMPTNEQLQKLSPDTRSAVIFIQIGECAARADPVEVEQLLATAVASTEERAAFAKVTPALGGCVPAGVDFTLPRLLARAYLAEGAYRNAAADQHGVASRGAAQ